LQAQRVHDTQNLVIRLALRQAGWQRVVQELGLEEQFAARFAVARGVQWQTGGDVSALMASQCVQRTAGLSRIAGHFGRAFFVGIQFFQNDHGKKNVMFLEAEQAHGVMQQHVGIKYKQFGRTRVL